MLKRKITICMMVLFMSGCVNDKSVESNIEQDTKDSISLNGLLGNSSNVDNNITYVSLSNTPYIFTGKVLQRNEERDEIVSNDKFFAYDIQVVTNNKNQLSSKVTVYIPYAKVVILDKSAVPENGVNIVSYEKSEDDITYALQNPLFEELEVNETYTFFIQYHKDMVSNSKFEISDINPNYTNYVTISMIDKISDQVSGVSEQDFIQQIQYKE